MTRIIPIEAGVPPSFDRVFFIYASNPDLIEGDMTQSVPEVLQFMLDLPPGYMTMSHVITPDGIPEITLLIREERFYPPTSIQMFPHLALVGKQVGILFLSLRIDSRYYAAPFNFHGEFGKGRTGETILGDLNRQRQIVLHFITDSGLHAVSCAIQQGLLDDHIETLSRMDAWTREEFQEAVHQVYSAYPSARDLMEAAVQDVSKEDLPELNSCNNHPTP